MKTDGEFKKYVEKINMIKRMRMPRPSQCCSVGGNSEEDTGSSLRKRQVVLEIRELGFFVLQLYN